MERGLQQRGGGGDYFGGGYNEVTTQKGKQARKTEIAFFKIWIPITELQDIKLSKHIFRATSFSRQINQ